MSVRGRRPNRVTWAGMFREDGRRTADLWTAKMRFPFSTPNPQARRLVNDNIGECRVAIPFLPKTLGMTARSCETPEGAPLPCGKSKGMFLIVAVRCPVCGEPICLDRLVYQNNYECPLRLPQNGAQRNVPRCAGLRFRGQALLRRRFGPPIRRKNREEMVKADHLPASAPQWPWRLGRWRRGRSVPRPCPKMFFDLPSSSRDLHARRL